MYQDSGTYLHPIAEVSLNVQVAAIGRRIASR